MGGGALPAGAHRIASLLFAAAVIVVALAPAARAEHEPAPETLPPPAVDGIYPAIFPVIGEVYFSDTYGAPRGGGRHHLGVDIMSYGVKGLPVVAAAAGTVTWISENCCAMAIEHDDGWRSYYIHLDNDTPGTDDGLGWGIADGIEWGTHVEAGQLIGWVGDSGNAESAGPHLHWELWAPDHGSVNPTPHAEAALRISEPGLLTVASICPEEASCEGLTFADPAGRWQRRGTLEWGAPVQSFYFGNPGDTPFVGDWDCDGESTPGLYRRSDGFVYLRNSNTQGIADVEFFFGDPGDLPLVGDFDGDGCDTVSIFRPDEGRVFVINQLGEDGGGLGEAEYDFFFGNPGDRPFVGDFDGDGVDGIGLHRSSTGFVYFRNELSSGVADVEFFYGDPGDVILAGDWDGDGDDTVAVYRPSTGVVHLSLENAAGPADHDVDVGGGFVGAMATR